MGRAESPLKDRLIFVVGARRSGTNWLQRVIAAHPSVVSVPSETYLFHTGLPQVTERFHHGVVGSGQTGIVYMDRARMLDALRDFCDAVFDGLRESLNPDAQRIVERTPDHVRHLDLMGDVYPDGRFIHIVRDGRDVARSLRSQPWGPDTIEEAAEEWRSAIEAAHSSAPGLEHYWEVRYEDLLADARTRVAEMFSWLRLDSDEQTVESVLAEAKVRYNVDLRSPTVGVGKWREEFSREDLAAFHGVAGKTLRVLGYDTHEVPADAVTKRVDHPRAAQDGRRPISFLRALKAQPRAKSDRDLRSRAQTTQAVANRLADLAARSEWDQVDAMLAETASFRIVTDGEAWEDRGPVGRRRFVDTLASDPVLQRSQVRGDFYPSLPTSMIVGSYRLEDGELVHRIWALTIERDRIRRITYYLMS